MSVSALTLVILASLASPEVPPAQARHFGVQRPSELQGRWQLRAGVGEIPFLAGSFKLALELGYHFNDYLYVGSIVQMRDYLERDQSSWNAERIGLEGLQHSREQTGVRIFLGTRVRPHRYSPYLAAGVIFNGSDSESMRFDNRERRIGQGRYAGDFRIMQRRSFGIRPAVGIGYSLELARGLSLGIEFTGAWFFRTPRPEIEVLTQGFSLAEPDKKELLERIEKVYAGNWHNRYHLFLLSAGYTF